MKQLWAPWRGDYVQSAEKDGKCVFCEAAKQESEDHHLLFCGAVSAVMLNKYPYNPGHLMVSPIRHAARIEELTPEESLDIFRLVRHSITVLTKVYNPEGHNRHEHRQGVMPASLTICTCNKFEQWAGTRTSCLCSPM